MVFPQVIGCFGIVLLSNLWWGEVLIYTHVTLRIILVIHLFLGNEESGARILWIKAVSILRKYNTFFKITKPMVINAISRRLTTYFIDRIIERVTRIRLLNGGSSGDSRAGGATGHEGSDSQAENQNDSQSEWPLLLVVGGLDSIEHGENFFSLVRHDES